MAAVLAGLLLALAGPVPSAWADHTHPPAEVDPIDFTDPSDEVTDGNKVRITFPAPNAVRIQTPDDELANYTYWYCDPDGRSRRADRIDGTAGTDNLFASLPGRVLGARGKAGAYDNHAYSGFICQQPPVAYHDALRGSAAAPDDGDRPAEAAAPVEGVTLSPARIDAGGGGTAGRQAQAGVPALLLLGLITCRGLTWHASRR